MATILKRGPVPSNPPVCEDDGAPNDMAQRARDLLGYQLPQIEVSDELKGRRLLPSLHDAMKKYDIRPFVPSKVARYKRAMERKHTPLDEKLFDLLGVFLLVMGVLAICGCCFFICATVFGWAAHNNVAWVTTGVLWCAAAFFLCLVVRSRFPETRLTVEWRSVGIRNYKDIIPEFVLQTACDLRKECPQAIIEIEELVIERIVLDPFLVVRLGSNRYHVEVWNEPQFKQKRMY